MPKSKHRRKKGHGKAIKHPGQGKPGKMPAFLQNNDLPADEYLHRFEYLRRFATGRWLGWPGERT